MEIFISFKFHKFVKCVAELEKTQQCILPFFFLFIHFCYPVSRPGIKVPPETGGRKGQRHESGWNSQSWTARVGQLRGFVLYLYLREHVEISGS